MDVKNMDKFDIKNGMHWPQNGLCFRCEHRASFLETGTAPRYECKNVKDAARICYNYNPVRPCTLKYPNFSGKYGEINRRRIPRGGLAGARMEFDSIAQCKMAMKNHDGKYTQYWEQS